MNRWPKTCADCASGTPVMTIASKTEPDHYSYVVCEGCAGLISSWWATQNISLWRP